MFCSSVKGSYEEFYMFFLCSIKFIPSYSTTQYMTDQYMPFLSILSVLYTFEVTDSKN